MPLFVTRPAVLLMELSPPSRSSKGKIDTLGLSKRAHIAATVALVVLCAGTVFQLALIVNRVYRPENGAVAATIFVFAFLQELCLMFYIFGLFWMIRRPNVLIIHGGVLALCTAFMIMMLIISGFKHQSPLAVGSTLTKIHVYFALRSILCFLAQIPCVWLVWVNVYTFQKHFKRVAVYSHLPDDDAGLSYIPPAVAAYRDTSSVEPEVPLDVYTPPAPSADSQVLSNTRDSSSM